MELLVGAVLGLFALLGALAAVLLTHGIVEAVYYQVLLARDLPREPWLPPWLCLSPRRTAGRQNCDVLAVPLRPTGLHQIRCSRLRRRRGGARASRLSRRGRAAGRLGDGTVQIAPPSPRPSGRTGGRGRWTRAAIFPETSALPPCRHAATIVTCPEFLSSGHRLPSRDPDDVGSPRVFGHDERQAGFADLSHKLWDVSPGVFVHGDAVVPGPSAVISSHSRASTNRPRCPTFVVATITLKPSSAASSACAARITSQSRAESSAVAYPSFRACAHNSAARLHTAVVTGR